MGYTHNTLSDGLLRILLVTWNSYALYPISFLAPCIYNTLSEGLLRISLVTCWNSYIHSIVPPSSVLCMHNTLSEGLLRISPVTWNSYTLYCARLFLSLPYCTEVICNRQQITPSLSFSLPLSPSPRWISREVCYPVRPLENKGERSGKTELRLSRRGSRTSTSTWATTQDCVYQRIVSCIVLLFLHTL